MGKIKYQQRDVYTCDGVQLTFRTTHVFIENSTLVFLNGILQQKGIDYTEVSTLDRILMASAPDSGFEIEIISFITTDESSAIVSPTTDFLTLVSDDVLNCFLNTGEFAEQITYTPYNGTAKSIKAMVFRSRLNPDNQNQNKIQANTIEIVVANDSIYGVATINKGYDKVAVPERVGGATSNWLIIDVINHDDGAWHLLARK